MLNLFEFNLLIFYFIILLEKYQRLLLNWVLILENTWNQTAVKLKEVYITMEWALPLLIANKSR